MLIVIALLMLVVVGAITVIWLGLKGLSWLLGVGDQPKPRGSYHYTAYRSEPAGSPIGLNAHGEAARDREDPRPIPAVRPDPAPPAAGIKAVPLDEYAHYGVLRIPGGEAHLEGALPRSPEKIRAAAEKLHRDETAPETPGIPETPDGASAQEAPPVPPSLAASMATAADNRKEPHASASAVRQGKEDPTLSEILQRASQQVEAGRARGSVVPLMRRPSPPESKRPWTERLFTPENIRILQSLGIGIIFISAVAFVRGQMWDAAGPWEQLGILLGGTLFCGLAGFALHRWTSLRITGLGFLLLGHLSLLLDTYASVLNTASGPALYPFAPASLWTAMFAAFAGSSLWHARKLKEPLFEAFAVFGALCSWGSAAYWFGFPWAMMPAAMVPALLLCAIGARALAKDGEPVRRWSVAWWLGAIWDLGGLLMALALPAVAVFDANLKLESHLVLHVAVLLGLALALLAQAWRAAGPQGEKKSSTSLLGRVDAAAVLLLAPLPLVFFARGAEWYQYLTAFALPAALLGGVAFALRRALAGTGWARECLVERLGHWGIGVALFAVPFALLVAVDGAMTPAQAALPVAAALFASLVAAVFGRQAWAAGTATLLAAAVSGLLLAEHRAAAEAWPAVWLGGALLLQAAWALLGSRAPEFAGEAPTVGTRSADLWALLAAALLVTLNPAVPLGLAAKAASTELLYGWLALLGYAACAALLRRGNARWSVVFYAGVPALLGLTGCAYALWKWPAESFPLACSGLALGAWWLAGWARQSGMGLDAGRRHALSMPTFAVALLGAGQALHGLYAWPDGPKHLYAVATWAGYALLGWRASTGTRRAHWNTGTFFGLVCGSLIALAALHGMRAASLPAAQIGPVLMLVALVLQALCELSLRIARSETDGEAAAETGAPLSGAPLSGRAMGLRVSSALAGFGALSLGWIAAAGTHPWCWASTLLMGAVLMATEAVLGRRGKAKIHAPRFMLLELAGFALLAWSAREALLALNFQMIPQLWPLGGALLLLAGMACESLAGAVLGIEKARETPSPFLESRMIAALGLGTLGLAQALLGRQPFGLFIEPTWRTIFACAALAVYGSMARWSAEDAWTRLAQWGSGLTAYVLLPLGYLAFLEAHSTGSSYGGAWFMLLAPLMLATAYVLKRNGQGAQVALAAAGAMFVNAGALVLAFAKNAGNLPEVPMLVFAGIGAQLVAARAYFKSSAFTYAACAAWTGFALFAERLAFGLGAWNPAPPVWEPLAMLALGAGLLLAFSSKQAAKRIQEHQHVALYGFWLATGMAVWSFLVWGMYAPHGARASASGLLRYEVLIACLALYGWVCTHARRALSFEPGAWLGPALTMLAYMLYVWKMRPDAWEWFMLPPAVFCFGWAYHLAKESGLGARGEDREPVNAVLGAASLLALAPSFLQAMPYEPGLSSSTYHYFALVVLGFALVGGAMVARRKVPLLAGSGAILLGTLVKAVQWIADKSVALPVAGIVIGFFVLMVGCFFESRMNAALKLAVDRAKAEAKLFWISWQ
ncbi:MAG: hypothetical protein L6R28_04580 [Planctomycetes bacterium]|nr:hypothetical protein [Planctomycetota bacterium]